MLRHKYKSCRYSPFRGSICSFSLYVQTGPESGITVFCLVSNAKIQAERRKPSRNNKISFALRNGIFAGNKFTPSTGCELVTLAGLRCCFIPAQEKVVENSIIVYNIESFVNNPETAVQVRPFGVKKHTLLKLRYLSG